MRDSHSIKSLLSSNFFSTEAARYYKMLLALWLRVRYCSWLSKNWHHMQHSYQPLTILIFIFLFSLFLVRYFLCLFLRCGPTCLILHSAPQLNRGSNYLERSTEFLYPHCADASTKISSIIKLAWT